MVLKGIEKIHNVRLRAICWNIVIKVILSEFEFY